MAPVLGIDLGTTNSVVCVVQGGEARVLPDADGNVLVPSVVSFHPSGDVLVGHAARERRLLDARNTVYSVKRLIGRPFRSPEVRRAAERFPFELCEGPTEGVLVRARGETYTLPEISAFVLREVRTVAEDRLGEPCTRAVITVPANFNELQRSATKAAGRVAGLEVLRILNEPTAAALAYGYGKGSRERIAVFDLGGGTFDVTILELAGDVFEVLATAGDTFLGGDDIDVLVAEKMADAFLEHHRFDPRQDAQAYERLRAAAEWAKCQLSSEAEVQLRVEELAYGDGGASLDLTFGMTRTALEHLAQPLIARAFDVCEDAMRVAGVRPTQLDNVVLVGGSTRIPLVRSMVAEYFGREPLGHIDPDLVVARGAALQAAALSPADSIAPPSPKQLARVALKRVSKADLSVAEVRRAQIVEEVHARRPSQPAFAPPKAAIPTWDEMDELPTRIAAGAADDEGAEVTRAAAKPEAATRMAQGYAEALATEQPTRAGAAYQPEPTRAAPGYEAQLEGFEGSAQTKAAPGYASDFGYETEQTASPSVEVSFDEPAWPRPEPPERPSGVAPVVAKPQVAVGAPAQAAPPPPPPASPSAPRRPPPPPSGGSTLGSGKGGLPVPEGLAAPPLAALPPAAPSPPRPPAPPTPPPVAPQHRPPLLLDVTPHTLGVETVGGYCEAVIARNAAIPVEQTRIFTTGSDEQDSVSVRIVQGESRRLDENQPLGQIELSGLRRAARGDVKISVTFLMDADGTLGVRAEDVETGRAQTVRIALVGGVSEDEVRRMAERQARMMRPG